MYPKLIINLTKIKENTAFIENACRRSGIQFSPVVKGVCADSRIVEILNQFDLHSFADSRLLNLTHLESSRPNMLVRIGDPQQAEDIVRLCRYSLQSEIQTIEALSRAAQKLETPHKVILMIDAGDLREGLMYDQPELIKKAAKTILASPLLILEGIGVNLTCFGGVLPDTFNLGGLVALAKELRKTLDAPIPLISGGNSSSLGLVFRGNMPRGINHLRIGESLLLGRDTAMGTAIQGMHRDAFTLRASLGEVQLKPSKPIGESGLNAFGEKVSFTDTGPMLRGIALVGRQDIDPDAIFPRDPSVRVLGASSDHLLLDLTSAPQHQIGGQIDFDVGYSSLLRTFTSSYISKEYIGGAL